MSFSVVLSNAEWIPRFCGGHRSCFSTELLLGCICCRLDASLSLVCPLTAASNAVSGSLCVNDTTVFSLPPGNSDCFAAYKTTVIFRIANHLLFEKKFELPYPF